MEPTEPASAAPAGQRQELSARDRRRGRPLLVKLLSASWGAFSYSALQLLAFTVITRKGGAADAGLFLLAQAIATPIALFLTFRLRDQIATAAERGLVPRYIRRQLTLMAPTAALGACAWFLFADQTTAITGLALLLANLAQSVLRTVQGGLIRTERFTVTSAIDTAFGALALGSTIVGYAVGGLMLVAILTAATWSVATVFVTLVWSNGSWKKAPPTRLVADAMMGLSNMGAVGQISFGRLGTSAALGQEALARVGTATYAMRATEPAFQGVLKVNAPRLASARKAGSERLKAVERQNMSFCGVGVAIGVPVFALLGYLIGPTVIRLIFGADVVPSKATVSVVWAASPILYASMLLSQLLVSRSDGVGASKVSFAAMFVTAVLVWPLASLWGEPGAAASILAGYATRCVTAVYLLGKKPPGPLDGTRSGPDMSGMGTDRN